MLSDMIFYFSLRRKFLFKIFAFSYALVTRELLNFNDYSLRMETCIESHIFHEFISLMRVTKFYFENCYFKCTSLLHATMVL